MVTEVKNPEDVDNRMELVYEGQDLSFRLKAKTTGQLQSDLLYAGDTRLVSGFFTCAAAGLFEANSMKFLQSYPVHAQIAGLLIDLVLNQVERRNLDVGMHNLWRIWPHFEAMPGMWAPAVERWWESI